MSREEPPTAAFPTPSHDDWRRAAEKALRGKPLESLTWRTDDGFELPPLVEEAEPVDVPAARRGILTCTTVPLDPESVQDRSVLEDQVEHAFEHGFDVVIVPGDDHADGLVEHAARTVLGKYRPAMTAAMEGRLAGFVGAEADEWLPPAVQLAETLRLAALQVDELRNECADASLDDYARVLVVPLCVGPEVISETAKLRALRTLWPRAAARVGISAAAAAETRFLAVQSPFHETRFEPENNLLRACLGAFAAMCGGADMVELTAYDDLAGGSSGCRATTLALNQVRMLLDESHLDTVTDPAAGAPAVEALTQMLIDRAWTHFEAVLDVRSDPQTDDVAPWRDAHERRLDEIVRRKRTIVGINRYAAPSADERVTVPGEWWELYPDAVESEEDLSFTASMPFAWLRDRVLNHIDGGGGRPVALVLAAGDAKTARARSGFAADFFRCGGFDVDAPDPGARADDVAAALAGRVFDVLVVCGDDDVVAAVEATSDMPYYRVGQDGSDSERLIARVFEGIDAVELLSGALDRIGVEHISSAADHDDVDDEERLADIAGLGEWD